MQDRQVTRARLRCDIVGAIAFTHHQQGIGSCELRGQWRAQRAGGKYASIADAASRIDHRQAEILRQRSVLKPIVHDDEAGALRARKRGTGDAIACNHCWRHVCQEQGLVADLRGESVCGSTSLGPVNVPP